MAKQMRPTDVRIFGRSFDIAYIQSGELGTQALGLCDSSRQQLSILDGQTPIEEADTVLHEVLHAIDSVVGLNLEERQVHHMAAGLIGVFQDNPKFAQWLVQGKNRKQ